MSSLSSSDTILLRLRCPSRASILSNLDRDDNCTSASLLRIRCATRLSEAFRSGVMSSNRLRALISLLSRNRFCNSNTALSDLDRWDSASRRSFHRFLALWEAMCCRRFWMVSRTCPRNLLQAPARGARNFAHRRKRRSFFNLPWNARGLHRPRCISRTSRPLILDLTMTLVFVYHIVARRSNSEYLGVDMEREPLPCDDDATLPFQSAEEELPTKKQNWPLSDALVFASDPQSLNMGSNAIQQDTTNKKNSNVRNGVDESRPAFSSVFVNHRRLVMVSDTTTARTKNATTKPTWNSTSPQPFNNSKRMPNTPVVDVTGDNKYSCCWTWNSANRKRTNCEANARARDGASLLPNEEKIGENEDVAELALASSIFHSVDFTCAAFCEQLSFPLLVTSLTLLSLPSSNRSLLHALLLSTTIIIPPSFPPSVSRIMGNDGVPGRVLRSNFFCDRRSCKRSLRRCSFSR
mmetsp:Transcript_39433/g.82454  ORF Transcript_39433/g.82454 Transcript_39433/m.82454 type:complete len:465 (+) Transcript_39433:767-2161(+)